MANTKVTSGVIKDDAVGADQLASNSVVTASINDNAITTAKIADDAILTAKISNSAITNAKMSANSVDSDQYVDASIDTAHIRDAQITSAKLDTNISISGELTVGSHLNMGDGDILKMGAGADLQIYHDGSHSYIDELVTGDLRIRSNSAIALLKSSDNADMLLAVPDGAVSLYYAGAKKLETASGGVTVTGTLTADDLEIDSGTLSVDASNNRVGIGTSSPSRPLHIAKSSGTTILELQRTNTNTTGTTGAIQFNASDDHAIAAIAVVGDGDNEGGEITFRTTSAASENNYFNSTTERMRIDSSGSLLVNTTSAGTNRLKIVGDASRYGILSENLSGYGAFNLKSTTVAQTWSIGAVDNSSNSDLFIYGGSSAGTKVTLDSSGNVGIGTSSPKELCDINGGGLIVRGALTNGVGSGNGLRFEHTSNIGQIYSLEPNVAWRELRLNASQQTFYIAGGEKMRIDSDGEVNIACTSNTDDAKLCVNGTLTVTTNGNGNRNFAVFRVSNENWNTTDTTMRVGKNGTTNRSINAGGTINASGADYAEYMKKADTCGTIVKGDVCGVDSTGKLTDVFADAISFVIKSTNPSYVGGDTWGEVDLGLTEEQTETERQKYDRIAFSGQVPVNITGSFNVGDYVYPQANGTDIECVAKSSPTFEEYQICVGKIWATEDDGRPLVAVKIG